MMKNLHAEEQGWKVFSGLNIQHINKDLGKKKNLNFLEQEINSLPVDFVCQEGFPYYSQSVHRAFVHLITGENNTRN